MGPSIPRLYFSRGCRYIAALAIAHPQLWLRRGDRNGAATCVPCQRGSRTNQFFNLPSLDVLCGVGGFIAQRVGVRVRFCQGYFARPGRPSGRRRADHTRCIGSHYLSPGPVSVRMCPAVHGALDAGVVPASQPAGRGAVSGTVV